MQIDGKSFNKLTAVAIIVVLLAIAFFLIKSIFLAILSVLLFACILDPLYKILIIQITIPTISAILL